MYQARHERVSGKPQNLPVADVPVLMSDGLMSAVVNRAALARLYDCAHTFTRRLFVRSPIPLSCSSAAVVSITGAVTNRAGVAAESFQGRKRLFGASGAAAALSTPGGKMGQPSACCGAGVMARLAE